MFKDLEEFDTSDSDSDQETGSLSKKNRLVEKVVGLREKLEKEEQELCTQKLECSNPSTSKIPSERSIVRSVETGSDSIGKISIKERKELNLQLNEQQAVLQQELNRSICKKDIESADKLSEEISNNEQLIEFNKEIIAKDYLTHQKEREELKIKRKRKKLNWVFESKKKWESKANM